MSLEYSRRASSMAGCLSDWSSIDGRKKCPRLFSKVQELQKIKFFSVPRSRLLVHSSSELEPCFNITFEIRISTFDARSSPRIPISTDDRLKTYAFDQQVSTFELRGHVFNMSVLAIMIFLGGSVWFLSPELSGDTLLALLCTVCSSGGCSQSLKNRVAVAAYMWTIGIMFFSQVLVDDMTSSITAPDSSRIPQLRDCALGKHVTHAGRAYTTISMYGWLQHVLFARSLLGERDPIICAYPSDIDSLRRSFDHRNLYRVKMESSEQKHFIELSNPDEFKCPPGNSATRCRGVRPFVSNSEWNDYALVVSRFELLRSILQRSIRLALERTRAAIVEKHGCRGNRHSCSGELVSFLSKFGQDQYDATESQLDFLSDFIQTGLGIALICFAIEFSTHYFPQMWSRMRGALSRLISRPRHTWVRRPIHRLAPEWF